MSENNGSLGLKVIVGVLAASLLALGFYTFSSHKENKLMKKGLEEEKSIVENELQDMISRYDEVIKEKEDVDGELTEAKTRIVGLLDSVKVMDANFALLRRYRKEISILKEEKKQLFKLADSLNRLNSNLIVERDSANILLERQTMVTDSLAKENLDLAASLAEGSGLTINSVRAEGVKVRNSGKVVVKKSAYWSNKVRVCFTIAKNKLAKPGDRSFYIVVKNPNGVLMGDKLDFQVDNENLKYSAKSEVYYQNDSLDVCMFVAESKKDKDLVKGRYEIGIYSNAGFIDTIDLVLK